LISEDFVEKNDFGPFLTLSPLQKPIRTLSESRIKWIRRIAQISLSCPKGLDDAIENIPAGTK